MVHDGSLSHVNVLTAAVLLVIIVVTGRKEKQECLYTLTIVPVHMLGLWLSCCCCALLSHHTSRLLYQQRLLAVLLSLCSAVLLMLHVHLQDVWFGVVKDGEPSAATIINLLFISANEGSESMFYQVMEFDKSHTQALSSAGSAAPVFSNTTAPQKADRSSGAHPETSVQQQQRQPAQVIEQLLLTCPGIRAAGYGLAAGEAPSSCLRG